MDDLYAYYSDCSSGIYPPLYLCKDLYDILMDNPYIYIDILWEKTKSSISKDDFFYYLGVNDDKLFNSFKRIIKTFLVVNFSVQVDYVLLDYPFDNMLISDSRFITTIYSVTHCWMLIFSKMISAFSDYNPNMNHPYTGEPYPENYNLHTDEWKKLVKKYPICKKLKSFGVKDYSISDLHTE